MRLHPQVHDHVETSPGIDATTKSIILVDIGHKAPDIAAGTSFKDKQLLARLSKRVETLGLLLHHRWELGLGALMLDVRHGPLITRRWTQQGHEIFSKEGQALAMTLDCNRFIGQRFTLVLSIMHHTLSMSRLSLTTNLSLSFLAPSHNPIFRAIELGDMDHIRRMIKTEPLAMSTVTRGGYTLLHASGSGLCYRFVSDHVYSAQHAMVDMTYYPSSQIMVQTSTPLMTAASK
jgi:hypothetical protein